MQPAAGPTIVAIATPPGRGGVGIVRVSGPHALDVLRRLAPRWPRGANPRELYFTRLVDDLGDVLDECLAVYMPGPRSFTGEDVVEMQCHGSPLVLRSVVRACCAAGARIAAPGEFTQRAYLNGRLDLTQAEAVADLINATSSAAKRLAMDHLEGALGGAMRDHLTALTEAMVLVEAAIDFSHEEHVYQAERDEILGRLDRVDHALRGLVERFDQGRRQREGVVIVLCGATNAGKSSVFNALHGTERAIVTEVAGTTRDFIEEELVLGSQAVRLIDTAGLRSTADRVEAIGMQRTRAMQDRADVLLWVIDRSRPLAGELQEELEREASLERRRLVCLNKSDRSHALYEDDYELLGRLGPVVETSAVVPGGTRALEAALEDIAEELTRSEGVLLSRARHLEATRSAVDAIARARGALIGELDLEIVAIEIRDALDAVGSIVGEVTTDDILNRIFGEFCVGK